MQQALLPHLCNFAQNFRILESFSHLPPYSFFFLTCIAKRASLTFNNYKGVRRKRNANGFIMQWQGKGSSYSTLLELYQSFFAWGIKESDSICSDNNRNLVHLIFFSYCNYVRGIFKTITSYYVCTAHSFRYTDFIHIWVCVQISQAIKDFQCCSAEVLISSLQHQFHSIVQTPSMINIK